MSYHILPLNPVGGSTQSFELGSASIAVNVGITVKYNYSASIWFMDILDLSGAPLLLGVALVPGVDLMARFPDIQASIGSLVLIELNPGDYMSPSLLGVNTQLLWFPVGTEVIIPV